jgi:hypothetical protein
MPYPETVEALRAAGRALRAGGKFVLESATVAESLLPDYRAELEYEAGGVKMRARHEYDVRNSRLVGDFTFEDADGRVERAGVIHHVHTTAELIRMLGRGLSRGGIALRRSPANPIHARIPPSDRDFKDLALP